MASFVKTKLRQTFAPYKKKPQLEQQHLSDIFWASSCANNKIGVVCVCVEHFTTLPPFCVVMVHAKIPTGYSCPVGRQGTKYLLVKWSCQLTKSKFGLFQFRPVCRVDQSHPAAYCQTQPSNIWKSHSASCSAMKANDPSFLCVYLCMFTAASPCSGHERQPGGESNRSVHLRDRHERQQTRVSEPGVQWLRGRRIQTR